MSPGRRQLVLEWIVIFAIATVAVATIVVVWRWPAWALLLVPLAVVVTWLLVVAALGYRPATEAELRRVTGQVCWHVSSTKSPVAVLDPRLSRMRSRMFFAAAPWRRPRPAVYFFTRYPDRDDFRSNIGRPQPGNTRHTVHAVTVTLTGPLYLRRDGAAASTSAVHLKPSNPSEGDGVS